MKSYGLILIDKPPSISSFAALGQIKRKLGTRKIGHTGTLDPFATGLLVLLAGSYTRLADYVTGLDKRYEATVRFGVATDTMDRDGRQTALCDPPDPERLRAVIPRFIGQLSQRPPAYSAVKIGGRRAYELARAGEIVEVSARRVEVFDLALRGYDPPLARFCIHCSKGTYVRSLARDIAAACDSCAHVSELRRTDVGPFSLQDAVRADDFDPESDLWSAERFIDRVPGISVLTLGDSAVRRVRHGGAVGDTDIVGGDVAPGTCALLDSGRNLLALADFDGTSFRYRCVLTEAG